MRLDEILAEAVVKTIVLNGIQVTVDTHHQERQSKREVPQEAIDAAIQKIVSVKRQIKRLENNQKFWLYDPTTEIGLGMRKYPSGKELMNVSLKTVVGNKPWDSAIPIITLP